MKFGVEVEMESSEYINHDEVWDEIEDLNGSVNEVKEDGSLNYGAEVTSIPLDSIPQIFEFIKESKDVLRNWGCYEASPSALHIHVSNHKKPSNLNNIACAFGEVFNHIKEMNHNELCHDYNYFKYNYEIRQHLERGLIVKDDNDWVDYMRRLRSFFMRYRSSTLRAKYEYQYPTMEFRCIPNNRASNKYLDVWEKIYTSFINKGTNMNLDKGELLGRNLLSLPLGFKLVEFKKFFELSNKELDVLCFKQNRDSDDKMEQRINRSGNSERDIVSAVMGY
jgi:hypothetical protein